jgi:hypothetical protein
MTHLPIHQPTHPPSITATTHLHSPHTATTHLNSPPITHYSPPLTTTTSSSFLSHTPPPTTRRLTHPPTTRRLTHPPTTRRLTHPPPCRYQCDGFFQGGAPPWLDTQQEHKSTHEPPAAAAAWDGAPVEPSAAWTPVWKAAWEGMARTDPEAKWLYQGWAIRGWNDADGASRIRALYDAVPHGQWIPLDMDVAGIWRYFGNYRYLRNRFVVLTTCPPFNSLSIPPCLPLRCVAVTSLSCVCSPR